MNRLAATPLGELLQDEPRMVWVLRHFGVEPDDPDELDLTLAGFCRIKGLDVHVLLHELVAEDDDEPTLELPDL